MKYIIKSYDLTTKKEIEIKRCNKLTDFSHECNIPIHIVRKLQKQSDDGTIDNLKFKSMAYAEFYTTLRIYTNKNLLKKIT